MFRNFQIGRFFAERMSVPVCRRSAMVAAMLLAIRVAQAESPTVVELFTSQGCYSCPKADDLLAELIDSRTDVIAIEWHVDYWNQLVYGQAGRWEDPFSSSAYSARQQRYNALQLDGRRGVYTPQAVVNGRYAAVGSDRTRLLGAIGKYHGDLSVSVRRNDDQLAISVTGEPAPDAALWLISYLDQRVTEVTAGENHKKTLVNRHIVTSIENLGGIENLATTTDDTALKEFSVTHRQQPGTGCVILLQSESLGQIHGAAYC